MALVSLEILHGLLVLLCGLATVKRAQIPALTSLWIFLP